MSAYEIISIVLEVLARMTEFATLVILILKFWEKK